MTEPWVKMAENNAWANARLYRAIAEMSVEDFAAPRSGFFPSLCQTLNHIYEVDLFYLDALEKGGRGRSVFDREEVGDPVDLGTMQAMADARFINFCTRLTPGKLAATCVTERKDGPVEEDVAAVILHLVQHQIHHRGQAHVQLSEAGIDPPQLDEFYLADGRAPSAVPFWE